MLNYYRARNHLVSAEQDVEALRSDCVRYSDLVWITQDKSVKVQVNIMKGGELTIKFLLIKMDIVSIRKKSRWPD